VFSDVRGGVGAALGLERADGTVTAAEAQRAIMAMARKVRTHSYPTIKPHSHDAG